MSERERAPAVFADLLETVARVLAGPDCEHLVRWNNGECWEPYGFAWEKCLPDVDVVLAAISAAGYVIRPREPTKAMIEAAARAIACGEPNKGHKVAALAALYAVLATEAGNA